MSDKTWTIQEALNWTIDYLTQKGDEHARRSAQYLLSFATGLSRIEVYAYFDRPLSTQERTRLREALKIRATGAPLQYACGEAPFRYLTLKVTQSVLIPRPETEMLVDLVLAYLQERSAEQGENTAPVVADIGAGSGCIALSIASEHEAARVWASDISGEALNVARENTQALNLEERVSLLGGNLAEPVFDALDQAGITHIDVLASNPPYIPQSGMETLPADVANFEPHEALAGGEDGLDLFRELIEQVRSFMQDGGTVGMMALELDERNVECAAEYLRGQQMFGSVEVVCDLTRRPRFLVAK